MNGDRQVDTPNYKGKDRRNGRLKLSLRDIIWIGTLICGTVVTLIIWYANTTAILTAAAENCKANTATNQMQDKAISVLQNDIQYIKEAQTKINAGQQENQKLLHRILGKLEQ